MFQNINFESKRLRASRLTKEDAPMLFQIYSDAEAMKFRGSKPLEKIEDAFKMINEQFSTKNKISKWSLGIRKKADHRLIGSMLLIQDENFKNTIEIGFSFGKENWGKGYGQETLRMIEEKLHTIENIEALKAWCVKDNHSSIRIFKKAGFSEVKQSDFPQSYLFIKKISHFE